MKTRIAIWLLALMTIGARADLTAVVTPGYQFPPDDSVSPTTQLLNLLGQPSVQIYGTVGGSNNISPGSITGISMSDSFPDGGILNLPLGSTLGWNVNSPRQLAVNTAGLVNDLGGIMANSSSNALYLDLDPGFFVLGTNSLNGTNSNTGYTNVFWLTFSHAGDLWLSNFVFAPWLIQTTNQSVNAWGTNAFEVTNLFIGTNLAPTLTATDTVPIVASAQGGPTAATLAAIGQYLASQNTLPPYTVGRVQFNGTNFYAVVSNAFTGGATLCISNYFISGIQAVVFATNGVFGSPPFTGLQVNQAYYVVPSLTNANFLYVYSNYPAAYAGNPAIAINSTPATTTTLEAVTNYTAFNMDAVPIVWRPVGGSTPNWWTNGAYQLVFRTPALNNLYYPSVTVLPTNNAVASAVALPVSQPAPQGVLGQYLAASPLLGANTPGSPTTNGFCIVTLNAYGTNDIFPRVYVQVFPQ